LVTYYGPDVLYGFAGPVREEIKQNMIESWFDGTVKELRSLKNFRRTDNKRLMISNRQCIRKGEAEGQLIGGYLEIICLLIAANQLADFKNKILFLENMGDSPTIHMLLQTLKLAGVFDRISGLILGFFPDAQPKSEKYRSVGEIVLEITKEYSFPVLQINELGHNVENYVFPMGIKTRLDATNKTVEFLEKLVR
jgi:muramoyltetrapeptide carboxypeptidase